MHQNNVEARFLGSFTKDLRRILVKNGEETSFPKMADDPYARFLIGKTVESTFYYLVAFQKFL
ncbi:MAG: hypothetical protein O2V44_09010 [Candidatus Bathyarchaeota archaeon]|nr:hypothetical protein [Candidatus Bathyarchaeota archaeon]